MYDKLNLYDTIRDRFDSLYPFSLISNVILYRNDRKEYDLFANEIDHLFHYKKDEKDHLVIVEVKQRKLYGYTSEKPPTAKSPWTLKYIEKAIADRAQWRADERRWYREGKLPQPGWWQETGLD